MADRRLDSVIGGSMGQGKVETLLAQTVIDKGMFPAFWLASVR